MIEAKNSINLNITEELIENVSCLQSLSRDMPLFFGDRPARTAFAASPTTQFKITNLTSKAIIIRPNLKSGAAPRERALKHQSRFEQMPIVSETPQVQQYDDSPQQTRELEGLSLESQRGQLYS
jgi:hypothetical protein